MAFMEPQIEYGEWYECDTDNGIEFVPADLLAMPESKAKELLEREGQDVIRWLLTDYCEGEIRYVKLITGYGARLSAPGYLDCAPWAVFETEQEAIDYLKEETEDDTEDFD